MDISGIWKDKPTTIGGLIVAIGLTVAVSLGYLTAEKAVGVQGVLVTVLAGLCNLKKKEEDVKPLTPIV